MTAPDPDGAIAGPAGRRLAAPHTSQIRSVCSVTSDGLASRRGVYLNRPCGCADVPFRVSADIYIIMCVSSLLSYLFLWQLK